MVYCGSAIRSVPPCLRHPHGGVKGGIDRWCGGIYGGKLETTNWRKCQPTAKVTEALVLRPLLEE